MPGYIQLLLSRHCRTRRLFAITEGGVEDADVVGVGDSVGNVLGSGYPSGDKSGGSGTSTAGFAEERVVGFGEEEVGSVGIWVGRSEDDFGVSEEGRH